MRSLVLLLAPLAMAATMGSNKVDGGDGLLGHDCDEEC